MRIDYYVDSAGWLWACIFRTDGTYSHWFLGTKDLEGRRNRMYATLSRQG